MEIEDKKSYYECKRCFFKCYQKNTMKKHLERIKTCDRIVDSYKYKDTELYDLSLIRIISNKKNSFCDICNKNFINTFSLRRHKDSFHPLNVINNDKSENDKPENNEYNNETSDKNCNNNKSNNNINCEEKQTNYITNIINGNNYNINNNTINVVNNNVSINIKNFDQDWNTSHIDEKQKVILLLKKYKFTSTLQNILENEVNLNVLIDNTTSNGLIMNNNKFEKMDVKEIVKKTMKKLIDSLNNFKNDIYEKNENDIDLNIIDKEIKSANIKYDNFNKNESAENDVNTMIKQIYNKKKDDTFNNYKLLGY